MTKMMSSPKVQEVMDYIIERARETKSPPTLREMADHCGIASTSTVSYYLDELERRGWIARDRKITSGIRITFGQPTPLNITAIVKVLEPFAAAADLNGLAFTGTGISGIQFTDLLAAKNLYRTITHRTNGPVPV